MHLAALLLWASVVSLPAAFSNSIQQCESVIREANVYNCCSFYSTVGETLVKMNNHCCVRLHRSRTLNIEYGDENYRT
jgi:hypothetical protein